MAKTTRWILECEFTLRIFRAGDHLLRAEDGSLAVVGEDSNTSFKHSHGGKGVAATA